MNPIQFQHYLEDPGRGFQNFGSFLERNFFSGERRMLFCLLIVQDACMCAVVLVQSWECWRHCSGVVERLLLSFGGALVPVDDGLV